MNQKIVPSKSRAQARSCVQDEIEQWRNFAQKITKNPFVKAYLYGRDGYRCANCRGTLNQHGIIHHTTYEHSCTYNKTLRVVCPTPNQPLKTRVVPDCENCKLENEDRFIGCAGKLVLVHGICNKILSNGLS